MQNGNLEIIPQPEGSLASHLAALHRSSTSNQASFVGSGLMVQQTTGGQIVERDPLDWGQVLGGGGTTSDKPARWG